MDFESEIKNYLLETYCIEYTSTMKIHHEDNSYVLELALNRENKPLIIGGEFMSDDDFLNYIKKEITKRRFFILEVYHIKDINTNPDASLL